MICIRLRKGRSCLLESVFKSQLSNRICPADLVSRQMAWPSVVFPEPDSPTIPKVSPCLRVSETLSTAFIVWVVIPQKFFFKGNSTLRFFTSKIFFLEILLLCFNVLIEFINVFVYSFCGDRKIFSVSPCSMILPDFITMVRSAILRMRCRSCEMKIMDICNWFFNLISKSMIWDWTVTSNAVVGSSAIRMSGRLAMAIAIITLCRWPPESWCG